MGTERPIIASNEAYFLNHPSLLSHQRFLLFCALTVFQSFLKQPQPRMPEGCEKGITISPLVRYTFTLVNNHELLGIDRVS
jgi:hypothetical protein